MDGKVSRNDIDIELYFRDETKRDRYHPIQACNSLKYSYYYSSPNKTAAKKQPPLEHKHELIFNSIAIYTKTYGSLKMTSIGDVRRLG